MTRGWMTRIRSDGRNTARRERDLGQSSAHRLTQGKGTPSVHGNLGYNSLDIQNFGCKSGTSSREGGSTGAIRIGGIRGGGEAAVLTYGIYGEFKVPQERGSINPSSVRVYLS